MQFQDAGTEDVGYNNLVQRRD